MSTEAVDRLKALFSSKALLHERPIGPAAVLDMIRYVRRRAHADALAEGLTLYLLPQLEGLEQGPAAEALKLLTGCVEKICSAEATRVLRQRYQELFPHLTFSGA